MLARNHHHSLTPLPLINRSSNPQPHPADTKALKRRSKRRSAGKRRKSKGLHNGGGQDTDGLSAIEIAVLHEQRIRAATKYCLSHYTHAVRRFGLPPAVRSRVWDIVCGAAEERAGSPGYYRDAVAEVEVS